MVKKKRGVGKNYYVELFGEILAITKNGKLRALTQMGNSGLDGAISPTGVAFLEGEGAITGSPDTAKNPTPYSLVLLVYPSLYF